jgi:hypothetical protein
MTNTNTTQNDTNDGETTQITEELGSKPARLPANETGSYGFVTCRADGTTNGYTECASKAHALQMVGLIPQAVACKIMWVGQVRKVRRMDGSKL